MKELAKTKITRTFGLFGLALPVAFTLVVRALVDAKVNSWVGGAVCLGQDAFWPTSFFLRDSCVHHLNWSTAISAVCNFILYLVTGLWVSAGVYKSRAYFLIGPAVLLVMIAILYFNRASFIILN